MSKGVQMAVAVLTVIGAITWIVSSSEGTFSFFPSVNEFHQNRVAQESQTGPMHTPYSERDFRVRGFVLEGSIHKDFPASRISFVIRDEKKSEPITLPVVYPGIDLPDLFRDGAEVVVEGRYAQGEFTAQKVMAKCPSKYENAPENAHPGEEPGRVAVLGDR